MSRVEELGFNVTITCSSNVWTRPRVMLVGQADDNDHETPLLCSLSGPSSYRETPEDVRRPPLCRQFVAQKDGSDSTLLEVEPPAKAIFQ